MIDVKGGFLQDLRKMAVLTNITGSLADELD
jgi:hypothetical protein